ncbi:hypothetical protein MRX96_012519 [Rhipicephalus microplus]
MAAIQPGVGGRATTASTLRAAYRKEKSASSQGRALDSSGALAALAVRSTFTVRRLTLTSEFSHYESVFLPKLHLYVAGSLSPASSLAGSANEVRKPRPCCGGVVWGFACGFALTLRSLRFVLRAAKARART